MPTVGAVDEKDGRHSVREERWSSVRSQGRHPLEAVTDSEPGRGGRRWGETGYEDRKVNRKEEKKENEKKGASCGSLHACSSFFLRIRNPPPPFLRRDLSGKRARSRESPPCAVMRPRGHHARLGQKLRHENDVTLARMEGDVEMDSDLLPNVVGGSCSTLPPLVALQSP
jgi:hypothetical protein